MEQVFYGYCRVSSVSQNEARQLIAMAEAEVPANNIYVDKQSGKDFNRPQYKRLLRKMKIRFFIFNLLIVWGGTIRRFRNSGGLSQKRERRIL